MLTKEQFLGLGWSDNLRRQFEMLLLEGNGKAFSANRGPDGSLRGRVWAEIPEDWDTDLVYVFGEPEAQPIAKPGPTAVSRTAQALQLIEITVHTQPANSRHRRWRNRARPRRGVQLARFGGGATGA